jgi:solute carrier family 25 carnitine/acylcarnitine transporter 20/29
VKKTLARDGPTGLYRGVVPPQLGVTPIFALSFWVPFPQVIRVICDL